MRNQASALYQDVAGTSTRLASQVSTITTHAMPERLPFSTQSVPWASLPLSAIQPWAQKDNASSLSLQRSDPSLGSHVISQTSLFPSPQNSHPSLCSCSRQNPWFQNASPRNRHLQTHNSAYFGNRTIVTRSFKLFFKDHHSMIVQKQIYMTLRLQHDLTSDRTQNQDTMTQQDQRLQVILLQAVMNIAFSDEFSLLGS